MAARKLDKPGQAKLLEWLVAGYTGNAIRKRLQAAGYEEINDSSLSHYRDKWKAKIEAAWKEREEAALTRGLALKAERVARLVEYAEWIEGVSNEGGVDQRQLEDKVGKPSWGMEWRACLDDIAKEMGERRGELGGGEEALVKVYVGVDYEAI